MGFSYGPRARKDPMNICELDGGEDDSGFHGPRARGTKQRMRTRTSIPEVRKVVIVLATTLREKGKRGKVTFRRHATIFGLPQCNRASSGAQHCDHVSPK